MEVASYPVNRIQYRYRSTGSMLRDLPTLNIELVVEVGLKYTSPDSQVSSAPCQSHGRFLSLYLSHGRLDNQRFVKRVASRCVPVPSTALHSPFIDIISEMFYNFFLPPVHTHTPHPHNSFD